VRAVKKFESGVIRDPITVAPTQHRRSLRLTRARNISGVPVVTRGWTTGRHRHRPRPALREEAGRSGLHIMTPKERLVTVKEGAGVDEVLGLLHKHRIEKVLVVNDASSCAA
jgi:IMP dehydrogenase